MRLIDADAIKIPKGFFETVDNVPKFYDWLDDQPTIEAEPVKHGRWIVSLFPGSEHVSCSECGAEYYEDDLLLGGNEFPRYCPNCGAEMDLKEEAETKDEP